MYVHVDMFEYVVVQTFVAPLYYDNNISHLVGARNLILAACIKDNCYVETKQYRIVFISSIDFIVV